MTNPANVHYRVAYGPGRTGLLPAQSPLRTVRDSFPSYASSISKAVLMGAARQLLRLERQFELPSRYASGVFALRAERASNRWHASVSRRFGMKLTSAPSPRASHRGTSFAFSSQEDSSDSLAMKHHPDVGAYFFPTQWFGSFRLRHVSYVIRLITSRPLLFPDSHCCRPNSLPYGWPAMYCTWRGDSVSTFHIIDLSEQLR